MRRLASTAGLNCSLNKQLTELATYRTIYLDINRLHNILHADS